MLSLLNRLGCGLEKQLDLWPAPLRSKLAKAAKAALLQAWNLADRGARNLPDPGRRGTFAAAVAAGLDPSQPFIRAECLRVFAARSPMATDDGTDTAFLSARLTLTGPALQALIASVAPRLAAALTGKPAAQSVPALGAVSGAALNAAYLAYFREIAAIRFTLLAMGQRHGESPVLAAFRQRTIPRPVARV